MEGERGNTVRLSALSAGTLYVMVIDWKGMGVHPPPSPARADFSIMMGCTPEIGDRHSVYPSPHPLTLSLQKETYNNPLLFVFVLYTCCSERRRIIRIMCIEFKETSMAFIKGRCLISRIHTWLINIIRQNVKKLKYFFKVWFIISFNRCLCQKVHCVFATK